MSDITIWHNPRCTKSRQAMTLLTEKGITPVVVKYLETPPSRAQIEAASAALGGEVIDMVRVKEKRFKELGLSKTDSAERLLDAMAENPVLIERPIVFSGQKAAIGRPTEAILDVI